ncbi:salivary peroxidase/catechol oxidase-like isoform X1 [Cherax quadricarinatus]|uniref:salivary peroxidase/catechol oxidase-like isoform X1 n=2 Tax=Cherax quadricarinatus TaxID=27406 RepID=UPI00387EC456
MELFCAPEQQTNTVCLPSILRGHQWCGVGGLCVTLVFTAPRMASLMEFLFLMLWWRCGLVLLTISNTVDSTHFISHSTVHDAGRTFFLDTNTITPTHTLQANPRTIQKIVNTVQNFEDENILPIVVSVGDGGIPQPDYEVLSGQLLAGVLEPRHSHENDPNVSPYWADPEGRQPNQAPPTISDDLTPNPPACREIPVACEATAKYRSISGRCNNLIYPHLGTPGQPMPRILPPVYDIALMRTLSVAGGLLPNPRRVSLSTRDAPTAKLTTHNLLIMQLGQIVDHDLTLISIIKGANGLPQRCDDCTSWRDPLCAPIPIPDDDPHLQSHQFYTGQPRCLPFLRSGAIGGRDALGRPTLDQVNVATSFLDLSTVYGSDECRERDLRLYSSGMLIELRQGSAPGGLLPLVHASNFENCRSDSKKCFLAGDERSNEQLGLLVVHAMLFREHNRLAGQLSALNPHWNDERIYQEARRVNIAKYQHMVYTELLPMLVGEVKMADYRLLPEKSGYYQGYDQRVNPGALNEFATSVFRVGHTMIPDFLPLFDHNYLPLASVPLVQTFNNASLATQPGIYDSVLRGLVGTRLLPVDLRLVPSIVNQLFQGHPNPIRDLFARNIARGRDHGIGPYVKYREACGGGLATTFDDLLHVMPQQAVSVLRKTYAHIEDIDLFPGGLAETATPGGLVGPTFACIIAYQFLNVRRGDRFWYENADAGLTLGQLQAIRSSTSLARLVCDNMEDPDARVPARILHLPSKRENPLVVCDQLPSVDLSHWEEPHYERDVECTYQGQLHPKGRYVSVSPCLLCQCLTDGLMRCKPQLSGCSQPDQDDHCKLLC